MDIVTESNVTFECISKNESQEISANACREKENVPKNPLLYLFVQYVWDPRHGACYDGQEYKKLEKWLETAEIVSWNNSIIFRNSEGSLFCTTRKLNSTISYADFQRKSQDSRDMIILAHVAYQLRGMIHLLNSYRGSIHYWCGSGRTILHQFCRECLEIPANAPEDRICRIRKVLNSLIDMGASLYYAPDWSRETPLHVATLCKNQQILQTIISNLIDVEECDASRNTALHIVVNNCVDKEGNHKDGYVDFVRNLVSKGANLNAKNEDGATPIHLAAEKFQVDMLKFFADEGANFNERTNDGHTPLRIACKPTFKLNDSSKIIETCDFLIAQCYDLVFDNDERHMLLHLAAEFQIVEIVERLIELGVSVDFRTKETLLTPLYLAAKSDKLDNMKALVRAGADVNAEAVDGSTPIFMSALVGSYESMQFLMDQGSDLHRRDNSMGFTLLHMATNGVDLRMKPKSHGNQTEEQQSKTFRKLEVLLDKGLDVNDAGTCGVTPLQLAVLARNPKAVKFLLDNGAEVDLQASQWTPLHSALLKRDLDIVKLLVANGADVNRRGGTGRWSPLHLALMNRRFVVGWYPEAVNKDDVRLSCPIKELWGYERSLYAVAYGEFLTLLIDNGADVNVQNAFGETPLHLPGFQVDYVTEKLLDAGAHVNVQDRKGRLPVHDVCKSYDGVALKLLLDFGADINDDDISELIMKSTNEIKHIAIRHAIKRKLVGLPIAKAYEPFINAPEFADFREQCSKEAVSLIGHRDADNFLLYEFLRMNPKFQYHYKDKISRNYKSLEQLFPMYAGLIRGACRECAIRMQLLEPARIAWTENTGIYLPHVCVEHILSYLNNRYLKVLATTFEKITNIEDERIVFQIR